MPDAIIVNLENGAVTEYTGFAGVNSATSIDGIMYVCDSTGVHAVDADNDNGLAIDADAATGMTDFGSHFLKRVTNVWCGVRCNGLLDMVTRTDEITERRYHASANTPQLRELRVKLDRGVKSRYWMFHIRNRAGADFQLSSLTVEPQVLTRRVR